MSNATKPARASRKITIVTHHANHTWTASVFVGDVCHCAAARSDLSDAVATAVAIFRMA